MSALIELHDITKDYGSMRALDCVSLEIHPGVTGLLGPNGAGKSTLIKVLLGLLRTTSGTGTLLGYQIGRQNREVRARVGYMPEDDCFIAGLSGVESVQFTARLSRYPKIEALRRAHEILDFCGMGQERYRLVETYSTGMRQKLRFAQSLVHDPPVLILDEPTSGLDPTEREATLNRIRVLSEKHGKTILLCTHILPDVQSVSSAVVILAKGKVRVSDTLTNLNQTKSPSMQVRVLGSPDAFLASLQSMGYVVNQTETGLMTVPGDPECVSRDAWEAARSTESSIRSLSPTRTSLEEVFLEAVREQPNGAA